jgi:hypothetical protein
MIKDALPNHVVIKTHMMRESFSNNVKIMISRDIRNSLVSMMRTMVYDTDINSTLIKLVDFKKIQFKFDVQIEHLIKILMMKNNLHVIKYEEFINNHDLLYNKLEDIFDIKIDKEERNEISLKYSQTNVKKILSNLKGDNFKIYDETTHLHNNHISNSDDNSNDELYKTYLSEELIEYINLKYGAILVKLGYSI